MNHISELCEITPHEILHDMFIQFLEISSRLIQADKAKDVKRLLFSPQYIEHKISIFNEIFNRMKEQKNLSYSLRKVAHPFKSSLNSMFLPILSLPVAFVTLTSVNYVKNAIFENYFKQFSHFSIV